MINEIQKNIEEAIMIKKDSNIDLIQKQISSQLYYYLIQYNGFSSANITRTLRNTLKFDAKTRQQIFIALVNKYLTNLKAQRECQNRDDQYIKNQLEKSDTNINQIVSIISQNPRVIQRVCEVSVNSIVKDIQSKQKINSTYMQETAKQPVQVAPIVNTLKSAENLYSGLQEKGGYNRQSIPYNNPIEQEINQGLSAKRKNAIYEVGEMSGILDIGKKADGQDKNNQEDSILLYQHPENPNFKIALVADGMGGAGSGDKASYIATKMTMEWFKSLPKEFYNNDILQFKEQRSGRIERKSFHQELINHIERISNTIRAQLGEGPGTTFSSAIVRQQQGIDIVDSISIGDSKILKIGKDGRVQQLVKDDSVLYKGIKANSMYILDGDRNTIYSRDFNFTFGGNNKIKAVPYRPLTKMDVGVHFLTEGDMRFYKANNVIVECLGGPISGRELKIKYL